MPFRSQAQARWMFAAEARGELAPGTARRWAHETPGGIRHLPQHVRTRGLGAVCPNPLAAINLQVTTRTPAGLPNVQLLVYASNGRTLEPPYDRGLIVGMIADEVSGGFTVNLGLQGEPTRQVVVPLGNALLWKLRANGPNLTSAGTTLTDARPWPLGGGEEAVRGALAAARAALPGAQLAYWAFGDPNVRAQIETAAARQGERAVILRAFDVKVVGQAGHTCAAGEQPAQPNTPPQPDTQDVIQEQPAQAESGFPWLPVLGIGAALAFVGLLWYKRK